MTIEIIYPIIRSARFINSSFNLLELKLEEANGAISIAQMKVPENREIGVNKFWDRVVSEFDVGKLEAEFKLLVEKQRKIKEFQNEKAKATIENDKLKILFGRKTEALKLPYIKNASNEDKSLIRKAPDIFTLDYVIRKIADKYIEEKGITLREFLEEIEDSMYGE